MKTFTTATFTALVSLLGLASAQSATSTANASQSSAVNDALRSYYSSLRSGPVATSLGIQVALAGVPASVLASVVPEIPSLIPQPSSGVNLYSFATAPPVSSFTQPSWLTQYLGTNLQADIKSLQTSVVEAEASIARSVLSITAVPASATNAAQSASGAVSSAGAAAAGNAGAFVKPVGVIGAGAVGAIALGAIALL